MIKLRGVLLVSVIAFSMFALAGFIKPVQATPTVGTHVITAKYYEAYIYDDHDGFLAGAGEWYFRLYADGAWTSDSAQYARDGPGYVDFVDITKSWSISGSTSFKTQAREWDGWPTYWDYTSTLTVNIPFPWPSDAINQWYPSGDIQGDALHLYLYKIQNVHPEVGSISGPSSGYRLVAYTWSTTGSDPEGDSITYRWSVDGVIQPSTGPSLTYTFGTWPDPGTHTIGVRTIDHFGAWSAQSTKTFTVLNHSPTVGSISGPSTGIAGLWIYPFSTTGSDPEGDPIIYEWSVDGVVQPGLDNSFAHLFMDPGSHTISVRTRDLYGAYSSYSSKTVVININPDVRLRKWKVSPSWHHGHPGETVILRAYVKNEGTTSGVYVGVRFVIRDATDTIIAMVTTQNVFRHPDQSINGKKDPLMTASWTPTTAGVYYVTGYLRVNPDSYKKVRLGVK